MIGIINYGMGNLLSVANALDMLGAEAELCNDPARLADYNRLILPGVGAFGDCMRNLHASGFVPALNTQVLEKRVPILGICLGLQVMGQSSEESPGVQGLGWIAGDVVRLQVDDPTLRVPHVGWNNLTARPAHFLFAGIPAEADFYFVHSYHLDCRQPENRIAYCEYGGQVTAAVQAGNIIATQFHPEKSQSHGLTLLQNFLNWEPATC